MIYLALALLGFGVTDLARWSPEKVGRRHAAVAAAAGIAAVVIVAALGGMETSKVVLAAIVASVILFPWSTYDLIESKRAKPEYALAIVIGTILALGAASGSADPVGDKLRIWYANLDFGFTGEIPVDQFVLGVGAACFLLATGNRIVRFLLLATEPRLLKSEGTLRGGRVLGPMERMIIAASVVSGGIAGAGFVIAAKGLLRFREIRGAEESSGRRIRQPRVDEITEYFLIGTFASVFIAAATAALVLAAG